MHYAFLCHDKPGATEIRKANRDAHLTHLRSVVDQIFAAGPLLGEDGQSMIGSLLVVDFPDRKAAEAFAANDPYAKAGLFQSVTVTPWKKVLP
jgi:uncharacterized protein YciI